MNLLALDTATAQTSVAVSTLTGQYQSVLHSNCGKTSEVLGLVQELLYSQGMTTQDLDLIAVDVGPGSFTGLRVGIGVAQGLAYAAGLPVVGIGSLAALSCVYPGKTAIAALDARMNQVYWGIYRGADCLVCPRVNDPVELASALTSIALPEAGVLVGVGNGWGSYQDTMPVRVGDVTLEIQDELYPEALRIAQLAAAVSKKDRISPLKLRAAYVRNLVAEKINRR